MWPVILRELRAGSRRWTTYWLRLLAAGAVLAAIAYWMMQPRFGFTSPARVGHEIFLLLHWVVLAAIWIIVPMLTADTLSREKREGTLGLLFLTNLSARAIVFAKGAAAGLLALTLWLSVVPIMTLPVLMGGVPAQEIILSCSISLSAICGALAAGLIASSLSKRGTGALGLALILSFLAHLISCALVAVCILQSWLKNYIINSDALYVFAAGIFTTWNLSAPSFAPGTMPAMTPPLIITVVLIPMFSFLFALIAACGAALILRFNWQDKPKSKRQTETEKFFCSPVLLTGVFRGWMRRSLERNPIGWLEKRRVTGRIMSWIWLAIMISFATTLTYGGTVRPQNFNPLMWLLLITVAYVAAGSFRRERETGALELILVTPLSERQIINGRLRGLWSQFLPTFVLWAAAVMYISFGLDRWRPGDLIEFFAAYLLVPVVGLYFSLRSRFVLLAWLATMGVCFAVPQLAYRLCEWFVNPHNRVPSGIPHPAFITLPVQLTVAVLLLRRLRVNLARRSFSLR